MMGYINFFISRFRYKFAFACVAGVIIMLVNAALLHMPLQEVFADYGIALAVLLALGIYFWYPAFRYFRIEPAEIWSKWGASGRRKEKSEFADIRFDRVYENTRYALLKEPDKGYRIMATLENCTCVEFRKNQIPCKHMCKLADVLGLYERQR